MSDMKPKMAFVHDGLGKLAIYMDESVGQDAIVSYFGPRYQLLVIRGEPCTIFFDKTTRYFVIAPITNKQELMDRPGRYDYIVDLPEIPAAAIAATAATAATEATAATAATAATEATGSPQSTEKICRPYPTNSWTLFMQEKWEMMRKANPKVSFAEVSTEASRQWKAMSDEGKRNYQETAWELSEQHKLEHGDHCGRSRKK